jgi:hypothetical protein
MVRNAPIMDPVTRKALEGLAAGRISVPADAEGRSKSTHPGFIESFNRTLDKPFK